MKIVIVVPWDKEYLRLEFDVSDKEKLLDLMSRHGITARQAARLYIVARERGEAKADMLPDNASLLNTGGAMAVHLMIEDQVKHIKTAGGKTYPVREYIAPVRDNQNGKGKQPNGAVFESAQAVDGQNDKPYLGRLGTKVALKRAIKYLRLRVPGYIMGRLLVISKSGGDVRKEAEWLKDKIDELVGELVEPRIA